MAAGTVRHAVDGVGDGGAAVDGAGEARVLDVGAVLAHRLAPLAHEHAAHTKTKKNVHKKVSKK